MEWTRAIQVILLGSLLYSTLAQHGTSPVNRAVATACSGGVTFENLTGTVNIPQDLDWTSSTTLNCYWNVEVPSDMVLNIRWVTFDLSQQFCDCYKYMQLYDDGLRVYRSSLRGSTLPRNFTSKSNKMRIYYYLRIYSGVADPGFAELSWQATQPPNETKTVNCGESLTNSTGTIYSPGYPDNYANNLNCQWNISAKEDEYVAMTLMYFYIEDSYNCIWDYVKITSKQNTEIYCGSRSGTSLSMLGPVTIDFHSDEIVNQRGFAIFYQTYDSSFEECAGGVTYNAPSGSFSNYPGLYEGGDFYCKWTITVDDNSVVELTMNDFYVPCSFHRVYIDESGIRWKYGYTSCGSIVEKPLRSRTNSITFRYEHWGYYTVSDVHFNITWKAIEDSISISPDACTKMNTSRGVITSPGYPNNYPNNTDLCWAIKNPNRYYIRYHIIEMDIEANFGCMADYLFVEEYSYNDKHKLCGVSSRLDSAYRNLTITMHSDDSVEKKGFALIYSVEESNGIAEDRSCGPGNLTAAAGIITSPGYPSNYQPNDFCEWTITALQGQVIEVRFLRVDMPSLQDEECPSDYIEISFGDNAFPKRICRHPGPTFNTTSNALKLLFFSGNNTFSFDGFILFYEAKDSTENNTEVSCGRTLNGVSYLQSPNYPYDYPPNLNCSWTIPVKTNEIVTLTYINLYLEQSVNCSADVLEISGINEPSVHRFCGYFYSSNLGFSYDANITIRFRSDMLFGYRFSLSWQRTVIEPPSTTSTTLPSTWTTTTTPSIIQDVKAYSGKTSALLKFGNDVQEQALADAKRAYIVFVSGGNISMTVNVGDVHYYLITGLVADMTYTIEVFVYDDNYLVGSVALVAKTTTACNLNCINSECILMEDDAQTCYCLDGYDKSEAGSVVCNDIDECKTLSEPCAKPSVCVNTIGSFTCSCLNGEQTKDGKCEESSICNQGPCLNNGTCVPHGSQYSCDCFPNYHGHRCEIYVSPCTQSPCQHGGTCVEKNGGYFCTCPSTFKGRRCTEDVNECTDESFTCPENSHCANTYGDYTCNCNDGYRGDGEVKCYEIILLPYGESEGDSVLPALDDVASPTISMPFGLQIGERSFNSMNVVSNGFISLGPLQWPLAYLKEPHGTGWGSNKISMISPFWDNFHPRDSNEGRVYYQVYDQVYSSLTNKSAEVVQEVAKRIHSFSNKTDFEPLFVLKATWSDVLMYYDSMNRGYPSTFQAIIATDLSDTFIIYYYKEDGMLFDVKKRFSGSNRALIGYTNDAELKYVEVQGNYRPDQRVQNAGGKKGQYFYHVTKGLTKAEVLAARASCAAWYRREVTENWSHGVEPCPCTQLQALIDDRFTTSVDSWLWQYSKYEETNPGLYRSANITEWKYDEAPRGNCYQFRIGNSNSSTPRCCFGSRQSTWSWWWGWWSWGPLLEGPFGSRYERHQIPIVERNPSWSWVFLRNVDTFERQYNESLEYDLIPRRQCCVDSKSSEYCKLYREMRPAATCEGYVRRWPAFFFGDPHITTSDGVLYSFNGLGEYHMVYAPGVFALQARTQKAEKDDGTTSDATVFVAFAAKDLVANSSGTVQFQVDLSNTNGDGLIVKIDGGIVEDISEMVKTVKEVTLTMENGTYKAIFPSSQSLSVSASNFLLSIQFTGDTQTMLNRTKGLLGQWDGIKENDFVMRNGTVVDWSNLQPIENLDILNGTLSEKKLYPFGQSWQLTQSESIFNYTGGSDTYEKHNPISAPEPPFLEDLVAAQRETSLFNEILSNCTTSGVISTTCLYDVLTTNRSDIGANTLSDADLSATVTTSNANNPPNITLLLDTNISEDGNSVLAKVNQTSTFTFQADDPDNDNVTFQLDAQNVVPGMSIDQITGVLTWTPTSDNIITSDTNWTLTVIATDSVGAESRLTVNIKLCACANSGRCLYNETLVGNENFEVVRCECTEAYAGDFCIEDRNGCELSACFANVTCTDVPAPGVGETCGDCPPGTTGDGSNCTNIDMCLSNPCQQECETLYNEFECSCFNGYNLINLTHCSDIDECVGSSPCTSLQNTVCFNTEGSYRCNCKTGFQNASGECVDIDECSNGNHNCTLDSSECLNIAGSFVCTCLGNYTRPPGSSEQSPCTDLDECAENLHNCNNSTQNCINLDPLYRCDCKSGFERQNGSCFDIKECNDSTLNTCDSTTSECVEQEGGYECKCLAGYENNNSVCENVNECLEATMCLNGLICVDNDGGYECVSGSTISQTTATGSTSGAQESTSPNSSTGSTSGAQDLQVGFLILWMIFPIALLF